MYFIKNNNRALYKMLKSMVSLLSEIQTFLRLYNIRLFLIKTILEKQIYL